MDGGGGGSPGEEKPLPPSPLLLGAQDRTGRDGAGAKAASTGSPHGQEKWVSSPSRSHGCARGGDARRSVEGTFTGAQPRLRFSPPAKADTAGPAQRRHVSKQAARIPGAWPEAEVLEISAGRFDGGGDDRTKSDRDVQQPAAASHPQSHPSLPPHVFHPVSHDTHTRTSSVRGVGGGRWPDLETGIPICVHTHHHHYYWLGAEPPIPGPRRPKLRRDTRRISGRSLSDDPTTTTTTTASIGGTAGRGSGDSADSACTVIKRDVDDERRGGEFGVAGRHAPERLAELGSQRLGKSEPLVQEGNGSERGSTICGGARNVPDDDVPPVTSPRQQRTPSRRSRHGGDRPSAAQTGQPSPMVNPSSTGGIDSSYYSNDSRANNSS